MSVFVIALKGLVNYHDLKVYLKYKVFFAQKGLLSNTDYKTK